LLAVATEFRFMSSVVVILPAVPQPEVPPPLAFARGSE
jgi:hypothetical protein